ncbi:hypothetical protein FSP39_009660 [Pinctada imbricata]|uniref:Nucleotide exchange factor SIL1 n=1 Tax=Pinctada imbricata TaxID=66713 RepID=A0AA88XZW9_PINIB|nr:hypothetical protein FSP39_009660 [Pinctada imbricata]
MRRSHIGLGMVNIVSVLCLMISCYYLAVQSEASSPGALSVVNKEEEEGDNGVTVTSEDDEEDFGDQKKAFDVFYPTKEWQTIKKGQAIPAGLHVRMNFETGEREAKLMEGDDGMKYWSADGKQGIINTDKKHFSHDELKKALKEFKVNQVDSEDQKRAEDVKKKFKKYEDLKKDMADIEMNIQTDGEIVTDLVKKLSNKDIDSSERATVLEDLEYYLHQIDNAVLFCDMGGMPLILQTLNSSEASVRSMSAFVLGSALQSNPKVQINAIEAGVVQHLIRVLSTDANGDVRKKALYAISSLIRHFPYAQKKFLEFGGFSALKSVFVDNLPMAVKIRVVTLLNDLLQEQIHVINQRSTNSEKHSQYQEIMKPIQNAITDNGICDMIPTLLSKDDHDANEKVLLAMRSLWTPCWSVFQTYEGDLKKLSLFYLTLAKDDKESTDFYTDMITVINDVIAEVRSLRDEL